MNASVTVLTPRASGQIAERVMAVIARETHVDPAKLRADATLAELNVDSVDVVMILNGVEEEFGVYIAVEQGFDGVKNVQDFVTLVAGLISSQAAPA